MNENMLAFLSVVAFLFVAALLCGGAVELRAFLDRKKGATHENEATPKT